MMYYLAGSCHSYERLQRQKEVLLLSTMASFPPVHVCLLVLHVPKAARLSREMTDIGSRPRTPYCISCADKLSSG